MINNYYDECINVHCVNVILLYALSYSFIILWYKNTSGGSYFEQKSNNIIYWNCTLKLFVPYTDRYTRIKYKHYEMFSY